MQALFFLAVLFPRTAATLLGLLLMGLYWNGLTMEPQPPRQLLKNPKWAGMTIHGPDFYGTKVSRIKTAPVVTGRHPKTAATPAVVGKLPPL
jgi:hypothetical protein